MNFDKSAKNRRIAFYGGSFDPPHDGHLAIARKLTGIFALDEFIFIPAFHAPHKKYRPTSAFHRYAMLCLATANESNLRVSTVELDVPEKPYTVETQAKLVNESPTAQTFFVIGADSWAEITTWRDWEAVLTQTNIIVVTRPDYEIGFSHVTEVIRERIVDLRGQIPDSRFQTADSRLENSGEKSDIRNATSETNIYISDAVQIDISATEIRRKIRERNMNWRELVPLEVAKYVEKYELYI